MIRAFFIISTLSVFDNHQASAALGITTWIRATSATREPSVSGITAAAAVLAGHDAASGSATATPAASCANQINRSVECG